MGFLARAAILVIAIAAVSGCVTAVGTSYGPADEKGFGYAETRLEADRFRVVFSGDGATSVEVVEDFALLRAAELTLETGNDWFRIVARSVEGDERGGVDVGAGLESGSFGRRGGVSVGVGGNVGRVGARRFFTARMEVLMGKNPPPEEDGEVYDARSIVRSIGPASTDDAVEAS